MTKKEIRGEVRRIARKKLNVYPGHDDAVLVLKVKITEGPEAFLDRWVEVEIPIPEFVKLLPEEVAPVLDAHLSPDN